MKTIELRASVVEAGQDAQGRQRVRLRVNLAPNLSTPLVLYVDLPTSREFAGRLYDDGAVRIRVDFALSAETAERLANEGKASR